MDDYNLRMGEHWIDTKKLIIDSEYLNNNFNVGLFIFFTLKISGQVFQYNCKIFT